MNCLTATDNPRRRPSKEVGAVAPRSLVGRPLNEVERFYIAQTLALTEGNREEAARRLGIGERTLYRTIQDWKLQDRIQSALAESGGDLEQAARNLGLKEETLRRKIKRWGLQTSGSG